MVVPLSSEESQYTRDSFSFKDSFGVDDLGRNGNKDDADRVQGDEGKHHDNENKDKEDMRNEVELVIAPVPPSIPSATAPGSLPSGTSVSTPKSPLSPTISPKWTSRRLPHHRRGVRGKPSPLRRLTYSAPAEDNPSTLPTLEIQGEQRSNKRRAEEDEDLVSSNSSLPLARRLTVSSSAHGCQESQDGPVLGHSDPDRS